MKVLFVCFVYDKTALVSVIGAHFLESLNRLSTKRMTITKQKEHRSIAATTESMKEREQKANEQGEIRPAEVGR